MFTLSNKLVAVSLVTAFSMVMYGCGGGGGSSSAPGGGDDPKTCAAGQTGIYPDCVDPPAGPTAAEQAAEAERIAVAIGPGATPADADGDPDNNTVMPIVSLVAGVPTFHGDDDGTDMMADFADSGEAPSMVGDPWVGAEYTRTRGMVMDTVVKYNNKEAPTDQAYADYYSTSLANTRDGVDSADVDGVLTLSEDQAGHHALFSITFGLTAEDQTKTIMNDTATMDVEENELPGMFNGVPGTFTCDGTCMASSDGMGNLDTLTGSWTFVPDDVDAEADPHMVTGVIPDADFMVFGYWLQAMEDANGEVVYKAAAIAEGNSDHGTVGQVDGSATYEGPATGLYMTKMFDPNTGDPLPQTSGQL